MHNSELCTLSNAINFCMSAAPPIMRATVCKIIKPKWSLLFDNNKVYYKYICINDKLYKKKALPLNISIEYVRSWIPDAIEQIRNINNLKYALDIWDKSLIDEDIDTSKIEDDDWLEI